MPLLVFNSNKTLSQEQRNRLAGQLSEITEHTLRKNRQVIVVRFDGGDGLGRWHAADGVVDPAQASIFDLSILITTGTNTEQEKSEWIAQAWRVVTSVVGESSHANYISVREINGSDWGYNGLTQNQRKAQAI